MQSLEVEQLDLAYCFWKGKVTMEIIGTGKIATLMTTTEGRYEIREILGEDHDTKLIVDMLLWMRSLKVPSLTVEEKPSDDLLFGRRATKFSLCRDTPVVFRCDKKIRDTSTVLNKVLAIKEAGANKIIGRISLSGEVSLTGISLMEAESLFNVSKERFILNEYDTPKKFGSLDEASSSRSTKQDQKK